MKCRRCGTELRRDDEFCYRCGERTTIMQRVVSSRMFVGSLIAVIIVIIAAVVAYLLLTDRVKLPDFGIGNIVTEDVSGSGADDAGDAGSTDDGNPDPAQAAMTQMPSTEATEEPVPTPEVFKPADVTEEVSSAMKPLLGQLKPFLAFSASFYADGSHAYKWDDVSATMSVLYKLQYVDKKIKYGDSFADIKAKVKKNMKNIYGKNCKFNLTYGGRFPDYVYVRSGDTVVYNAVGVYGKTYRMDCKKIIEYKKGKYRVIVDAYLYQEAYNRKGDSQKYTIFMTDADDSKYGYEITKIRLYKKADSKISAK